MLGMASPMSVLFFFVFIFGPILERPFVRGDVINAESCKDYVGTMPSYDFFCQETFCKEYCVASQKPIDACMALDEPAEFCKKAPNGGVTVTCDDYAGIHSEHDHYCQEQFCKGYCMAVNSPIDICMELRSDFCVKKPSAVTTTTSAGPVVSTTTCKDYEGISAEYDEYCTDSVCRGYCGSRDMPLEDCFKLPHIAEFCRKRDGTTNTNRPPPVTTTTRITTTTTEAVVVPDGKIDCRWVSNRQSAGAAGFCRDSACAYCNQAADPISCFNSNYATFCEVDCSVFKDPFCGSTACNYCNGLPNSVECFHQNYGQCEVKPGDHPDTTTAPVIVTASESVIPGNFTEEELTCEEYLALSKETFAAFPECHLSTPFCVGDRDKFYTGGSCLMLSWAVTDLGALSTRCNRQFCNEALGLNGDCSRLEPVGPHVALYCRRVCEMCVQKGHPESYCVANLDEEAKKFCLWNPKK